MIELKVDKLSSEKITFHIDSQCDNVYKIAQLNGRMFNGWKIYSAAYPELDIDTRSFYIRGTNKSRNFNKITCTLKIYKEIYDIVKEINNIYKYID